MISVIFKFRIIQFHDCKFIDLFVLLISIERLTTVQHWDIMYPNPNPGDTLKERLFNSRLLKCVLRLTTFQCICPVHIHNPLTHSHYIYLPLRPLISGDTTFHRVNGGTVILANLERWVRYHLLMHVHSFFDISHVFILFLQKLTSTFFHKT